MRFIIPIVVGAIIGYITNWFAIKMLFRPYNEKKIWGIHVPFTPGLIPKEKSRIARSVGKTIGVHLLSPEIVTQSLFNEKMDDKMNKWIKYNISNLKKSDKSMKTLIMSIGDENYNKILNIIDQKLTDFICSQLRSKEFKDIIINLIESKVFDKYSNDFYKVMREKVELYLYEISKSEEIKVLLKNIIEDKMNVLTQDSRLLVEIVPENVIIAIKEYIDDHDKEIGNALHDMFKNPEINTKLKSSITNVVSENISKVITIFVSPELISEKILSSIENNIDNPETTNGIVLIIKNSIDKFLQSPVSEIASSIVSKSSEEDILKISDFILKYISNKQNQKKVIFIMEEKIKSSEPYIKEDLLNIISNNIETILNSQALYNDVSLVVQDIIEKVINKPISYILRNIDETTITSISIITNNIFSSFVKNKLPYIIEVLNIPKVVEDQINSFDVAFAEEIIIEIANKELKAITWLGALLGGIMGMLSPLLQFMYK